MKIPRNNEGEVKYNRHKQTDDPKNKITIKGAVNTEHGIKAVVESPYEAKDDIKDLDFDETHRTWSNDHEAWLVDHDSIDTVIEHLTEVGHRVHVNERIDEIEFRADLNDLETEQVTGMDLEEGDEVIFEGEIIEVTETNRWQANLSNGECVTKYGSAERVN